MQITDKIITNTKQLKSETTLIESDEMDIFCQDIGPQMIQTMKKNKGVGLAAPQIGLSKRIFVMSFNDESFVCINPKIIFHMPFYEKNEPEGCLSIPDKKFKVKRPVIIRVQYTDENKQLIERELTEWAARIFQHELDHLNGILISDRGTEIILQDKE